MAHHRQFTAAFKAQVGLEPLSVPKSSAAVFREQQITSSALADWNAHFLECAASLFKSPDTRDH
jgi:hypothetical protein